MRRGGEGGGRRGGGAGVQETSGARRGKTCAQFHPPPRPPIRRLAAWSIGKKGSEAGLRSPGRKGTPRSATCKLRVEELFVQSQVFQFIRKLHKNDTKVTSCPDNCITGRTETKKSQTSYVEAGLCLGYCAKTKGLSADKEDSHINPKRNKQFLHSIAAAMN